LPTIITFSPLHPPTRTSVKGKGKSLVHECNDSTGHARRQVLSLGSVKGIFYLDALCPHCGAHLVWVDDGEAEPETEPE